MKRRGLLPVTGNRQESKIENLKKLIPLLLGQKYASFEVILVDDKSTDDTYDYAIELNQIEPKFK